MTTIPTPAATPATAASATGTAPATPAADHGSAVAWAVWLTVAIIVITATTNLWLLTAMTGACWFAAAVLDRRGSLAALVVGASVWLVAIWALLGVIINREGLGGPVVWVLPDWSSPSSGRFGGAVTVGQLHYSAARAIQALAVVAAVGLALRVVRPRGWMELAEVIAGRAGALIGPMLCLPAAWAAQRVDTLEARRLGFGAPRAVERFTDLADRAAAMARVESTVYAAVPRSTPRSEPRSAPRSGPWSASRTPRLIRPILAGLVVVWWALGAIMSGPGFLAPDLSGIERTGIALAALAGIGFLCGSRLDGWIGGADLVPLSSAAVLALAWYAGGLTPEDPRITVDPATMPAPPILLLAAVAVLPVLALASRRPR